MFVTCGALRTGGRGERGRCSDAMLVIGQPRSCGPLARFGHRDPVGFWTAEAIERSLPIVEVESGGVCHEYVWDLSARM